MPQPRKYPSNAARQAAYRRRKAVAEAAASKGTQEIVKRVMAADRAARG